MKAAVLHAVAPEVLTLDDVPVPVPGPTEILLRVAACGICGHDQAERRLGIDSRSMPAGVPHRTLPTVLGHEVSGVVEAVGSKVTAFEPGMRAAVKQYNTCGRCVECRSERDRECPQAAFNYGGFAEFVAVGQESAIEVPEEVDLVAASIVACAIGTTLRALQDVAKVRYGETVLVTGASGGLGTHAVQVAKSLGATVAALTSSDAKAPPLHRLGADVVVVRQDPATDWQRVADACGGRGPDVVLDTVGTPEVFKTGFRALARRGRYVFTGQLESSKIELHPRFIFGRETAILGSATTRMSGFHRAMELVRAGAVNPVFRTFALDDIHTANALVDQGAVFGRAVLTMTTGGERG